MCIPTNKATFNILNDIMIAPYSVLGTQLTNSSRIVQKAVVPGAHCMFVDPAGLPYIRNFGPRSAGGASAEIYRYIGINKDAGFPRAVRNAIKVAGDAYWHTYNDVFQCCHAVGPNFTMMQPELSEEKAIGMLTVVYRNIFRQFVRSRLTHLRLLPVSGGIYSGKFQQKMPIITFMAIIQAVQKLKKSEYTYLVKAIAHSHNNGHYAIEMCIFEENQVNDFQKIAKFLIRTVV